MKRKPKNVTVKLVNNEYMNRHYNEDIINYDDGLIEKDLIVECRTNEKR